MASTVEKLNTREAARHLGLAPATLAKMRCWGGSPPFLRLGRKVVYCRDDLDEWLNTRRAISTSDADRLPRRLTIKNSVDRSPSERKSIESAKSGVRNATP
jgi:Helix-turn-helix domain